MRKLRAALLTGTIVPALALALATQAAAGNDRSLSATACKLLRDCTTSRRPFSSSCSTLRMADWAP